MVAQERTGSQAIGAGEKLQVGAGAPVGGDRSVGPETIRPEADDPVLGVEGDGPLVGHVVRHQPGDADANVDERAVLQTPRHERGDPFTSCCVPHEAGFVARLTLSGNSYWRTDQPRLSGFRPAFAAGRTPVTTGPGTTVAAPPIESGSDVPRHACLLVALALIGGACGGGDDDAVTDAAAATATSPLAELLGYSTDPSDQKAQQQRFVEQERKVQEAVVDCMKKEGFDYTPMDTSEFIGSSGPFNDDIPFDSKEWAEKYGFGMSTTLDNPIGAETPMTPPSDPNGKYVESLSESERDAYFKALYGAQQEFDPTETEASAPIRYEPSGCEGNARKNVDPSQAFYTEFGEEMGDLFESVENDPLIVAASKKWAACMKKSGYEYETPEAMYEEANTKVQEFYGGMGITTEATVLADGSATVSGATPVEGEAPPTTEIDKKKLAEVQAWEKKVAVANWECSKDLNKVRMEVQARVEQDFIDANKAKIDELLAKSGG